MSNIRSETENDESGGVVEGRKRAKEWEELREKREGVWQVEDKVENILYMIRTSQYVEKHSTVAQGTSTIQHRLPKGASQTSTGGFLENWKVTGTGHYSSTCLLNRSTCLVTLQYITPTWPTTNPLSCISRL